MEKLNASVFLKVVETGSFKRAADILGYTQAGISYIINAMEEECGLKLFYREYGGVRRSHQRHQRSGFRNGPCLHLQQCLYPLAAGNHPRLQGEFPKRQY